MEQLDNSNISVHLGKTSQYKSKYDANLLVKEPRQNNRTYLGIQNDNLPFVGYDVWNGYEVSALTDSGKPIAGIVKVIYPCDSEFIVESKSMKLYWNSFNMTKLGKTKKDVITKLESTASTDLSKLLNTDVQVTFFSATDEITETLNFKNVIHLDNATSDTLQFEKYVESPDLLETNEFDSSIEQTYYSNLLKSNCRVTSQPDWGDIIIHMKSKKHPSVNSLMKYIVSFRDECHFHEEICECIYKRLWDTFSPDELSVTCLYVRRGGWDINPQRCSHEHLYNKILFNSFIIFPKQPRQ